MLGPGAAASCPLTIAQLAKTGDRRGHGQLTAPPPPPFSGLAKRAPGFPTHMPWDTQSVLGWVMVGGQPEAGSGQGIKVHGGQRLPPVAEVAVFRVDQVCAGAAGHGREEEFDHLAEPLVPAGRDAGGDLVFCLGALDLGLAWGWRVVPRGG